MSIQLDSSKAVEEILNDLEQVAKAYHVEVRIDYAPPIVRRNGGWKFSTGEASNSPVDQAALAVARRRPGLRSAALELARLLALKLPDESRLEDYRTVIG